jgi:hypothetical protein
VVVSKLILIGFLLIILTIWGRVDRVLEGNRDHNIGLLLLENIVEGIRLSSLCRWLCYCLDSKSLSYELGRLSWIRELCKVNPCTTIHWLHFFGSTTWLSTGLSSGWFASLGCSILFSGRKFIKVEPDTFVVINILLKFLDFTRSQCGFNSCIM